MKSKTKSKKWIFGLIAVVAIVLFLSTVVMKPTAEAYKEYSAKIGDITTYYSFSGSVETQHRQTVVSNVQMNVSDVYVQVGDTVQQNDTLLTSTYGTRYKAKIDGEVTRLSVAEGDSVAAGTIMVEIVDFNNLEISINIDEYDIGAVEVGKPASVRIDALDRDFSGTISSVSRDGQETNGAVYYTATIALDSDDALLTGMSAEVKVESQKVQNVVTLPMSVINFDENNNPYVLIRDGQKNVVEVGVEVGINDGVTVEVLSGVKEGDIVLFENESASSVFAGSPMMSGGTE